MGNESQEGSFYMTEAAHRALVAKFGAILSVIATRVARFRDPKQADAGLDNATCS